MEQMKHKDSRIKLMSEILNGIKVGAGVILVSSSVLLRHYLRHCMTLSFVDVPNLD